MTRTIVILSLVGLTISGYLTYVHYAEIDPFCTAISECERVQNSDFATLAGVPVALLGLLGYGSILASLKLPGENGRLSTAFVAFVGAGYSVYLTYVELFRIEAICQWCVISASLMVALAVLTARRVIRAPLGVSS